MKKLLVIVLVLLPALAMAHAGDHSLLDWKAGFLHPLTGLDHLLALLAVGVWLAQSETRKQPAYIGGFAIVLALAIMAGAQFTYVTFEMGVIGTLVVLGALVACAVRGSLVLRTTVVIATAAIHGFVHGTELPAIDGTVSFAVSLVLGSIAVVGSAALIGRPIQLFAKGLVARAVGILLMLYGLAMAFA